MNEKIDQIIKNALNEDVIPDDITTSATVPQNLIGTGTFLVKSDGVVAGYEITERVFQLVDSSLKFTKYFNDGDNVKVGDIIAKIEGKASSILTAERTALNFFQRMSGIATAARTFTEKIKHTKAEIIDTRKTVPGLRIIDKLAVKQSGCKNHRMGLYDMFLIKDNHIVAAGSITNAINACKKYQSENGTSYKIEVETKNLAEVEEALSSDVDVIMLDNFDIEKMKQAVTMINEKCKVEASGGVNLNTVKAIAETGVDYISVGALTHSVTALDISLNITTQN